MRNLKVNSPHLLQKKRHKSLAQKEFHVFEETGHNTPVLFSWSFLIITLIFPHTTPFLDHF